MEKDRESVHPVPGTDDAQIVYLRSSARPVEYAIMLQIRGAEGWETGGSWRTTPTATGTLTSTIGTATLTARSNRQSPFRSLVSDSNDAMAKVIRWLAENWTELT